MRYWDDDDWVVGQLEEVPNVFAQERTLAALKESILKIYCEMFDADARAMPAGIDNIRTLQLDIT